MSAESIKWLHSELEKILDEKVPYDVAEKIMKLIPESEDVKNSISQVYTYAEYKESLILLDKEYKSRLRQYGTHEELLYSFLDVTPGLCIEHRIMNSHGIFINTKNNVDPLGIPKTKTSNIYLLKRTEWDSIKYDGKKDSYTIMVYNRDNYIEALREDFKINDIKRLQDEARKKGK